MEISNRYYFKLFLNLFIFSCIFDPFGNILYIKDASFVLVLFTFIMFNLNIKISLNLLFFILNFISIPLISIIIYFFINNTEPYEGIMLLRSYLLIIIIAPIICGKIDLFKIIIKWTNWLSFLIFILLFIYIFSDNLFDKISQIGLIHRNMLLGERDFGDISFLQLYYVTSPLIYINVAYYSDKLFSQTHPQNRNYFFLIFNCLALFISGTRSNILISLLLPLLVYFYYCKNIKIRLFIFISFLIIILYFCFQSNFFNLSEESNFIKNKLLQEYIVIFVDIRTIFIGQGLGAYYFWDTKNKLDFITELTYLEIFRNYGLFLGSFLIYYIIYPLKRKYKDYNSPGLIIGYIAFLITCALNPLFFSSIGMLFYMALISNIFILNTNE